MKKPPRGLFVTGTNTEIGKSWVAAMIARQLHTEGHRVGVYKPVASGCIGPPDALVSEDADLLWQAAGQPLTLEAVCPQLFQAPLAPNIAARKEGTEVDANKLVTGLSAWADACDIVIVEGVGGLMSPVSTDDYVADLAWDFGYPLIVVAANELGVINQTLQTLITAETFRDGLPVVGVILNHPRGESDESAATNVSELQERCIPPLLAEVGFEQKEFAEKIDWWQLADSVSA